LDGKRTRNGLESAPLSGEDRTKKDILALLGITQQEIKWLNSKENKNRKGVKECLANIVSMISGLEKLPPNALLNIRDGLLREHAPEFAGGICKNTSYKKNMQRLLESRNSRAINGTRSTNQDIWRSISQIKKPTQRHSTNKTRGLGSVVSSLFGINTDQVETYSKITAKKTGAVFGMSRAPTESDKFETESILTKTLSGSKKNEDESVLRSLSNETDHFGRELVFEQEIKSWNDSHLIPKQIKK
jgi:hypothetical protein